MAKNYNLPWLSDTDAVRFHVGDKTAPMILEDEEITSSLTFNGWNDGLSACCVALASHFAQQAAKAKAGEVQQEFLNRQKYYLDLAEKARAGAIAQPDSPVRVVTAIASARAPRTDGTDLL